MQPVHPEGKVWSVIVHYGAPAVTRRILDLLAASTVRPSIVVVDNAGGFVAPEDVHVIRMGANLGFAGGANAGARHALAADAGIVWFLNNDAEPEADALERLLETVREYAPLCVVGALEVDPRDAEPESPDANRAPVLPRRLRGLVRAVHGRLHRVDFVSGFSLVVTREVFDEVGFFDETLFHYFEDVDYSLRAAQCGAAVVLDCGARIRHRRATSMGHDSEAAAYYFFRNRILLAARYRRLHPLIAWLVSDPRHGLIPLISRRRVMAGDWRWLRGAWHGTLDGLRGRNGPVKSAE